MGGGRGLRGSRYTYRLGRHLYEGGLGARGSSLLTHTTPYPIPRRRSTIALYNRLCARSIVNRRRGMGYTIPPWGKGLKLIYVDLCQDQGKKGNDSPVSKVPGSRFKSAITL